MREWVRIGVKGGDDEDVGSESEEDYCIGFVV